MNYIGSKLSILNYIDDTIQDFTNLKKDQNIILCDIFAGTACVGKYFKRYNYNIISNDIQYYSYVLSKHYIENNKRIEFNNLKNIGIENVFKFLNYLQDKKGFVYNNYTKEETQNRSIPKTIFY